MKQMDFWHQTMSHTSNTEENIRNVWLTFSFFVRVS